MANEWNVDRMLRQMEGRLFREWQAYNLLEPFDERRADWRAAQIVAMLAELNRDPEKRRKPWTAADFMLKFEEDEEQVTRTEAAPKKSDVVTASQGMKSIAMMHFKQYQANQKRKGTKQKNVQRPRNRNA